MLVLVLGLLVVLSSLPAQGGTVGYWRFEGTGSVGTEVNVASPGFLNGTGYSAVYSPSRIGPYIYDPVSGQVASNAGSLALSGGNVRVADDAALQAASFTIEAMINVGINQTGYPGYVSRRISTPARGWQLDIDPDEDARTRFDTAASSNQVAGSNPAQRLADQRWHHTAVTFDAATKLITHYVDYGVKATRTLSGTASDATAVAAELIMGGGWAPNGAIDEVRYSDGVLSNSQFLRAVNNAVWSFEGKPGAIIAAVNNRANPGYLAGTGEGGAVYGASAPGESIVDPVSGQRWFTTSSMKMGTGLVRVLDDNELDAPAFTIEAFVRTGNQTSYPNYISRLVYNVDGWQLDIDPSENARARIDTGTGGNANQVLGSTAAQSLADGDWHHVALTFDGITARLYVDYGNLASRNVSGNKWDVTEVVNDLLFGNGSWPEGSYLDEVRFSASPLSPSEFLRAEVPEPMTLTLLLSGGAALGGYARRRR